MAGLTKKWAKSCKKKDFVETLWFISGRLHEVVSIIGKKAVLCKIRTHDEPPLNTTMVWPVQSLRECQFCEPVCRRFDLSWVTPGVVCGWRVDPNDSLYEVIEYDSVELILRPITGPMEGTDMSLDWRMALDLELKDRPLPDMPPTSWARIAEG